MVSKHEVILRDMRSGRFICLIAMLVLGVFSITTISLLIRSEKKTEIEEALTITGDYDEIIYDTNIGLENSLFGSDLIDDIGLYYELGSITDTDDIANFKAVAFKDKVSENIYHMTCIRGNYPQNNNEIAIDISVANTYGIAPYNGETLALKLYNSKGEYIQTRDYVVSGVFEGSNNEVIGGWNRCPGFAFDTNSYRMPAVFFYNSDLDVWECTNETVFFNSHSSGSADLNNEVSRILNETGSACAGYEYNSRRSNGYSWYIGLDELSVNSSSDDFSWETIQNAVNRGLYKRDFYSAVVFPLIFLMVVVTEAVSIYMLTKNIIEDRKEHYAILRCIGMSSRRIVRSLILEMLVFGLLGVIAGIGLGYASHIVMIKAFNDILHIRLSDGIHVSHIVDQITFNPIFMSVLVCFFSLAISFIIPLVRLYKSYPAELLSTTSRAFVDLNRKQNIKVSYYKKGWLRLLNKRIDLHDGCTMLVMMIVLSSFLLGYVFFRAFSEQITAEERGYMEMLGINGKGYVASRSSSLQDWGYIVSNRHDAGVKPSFADLIENNSDVEKSWAVIFNESTRMVFDEEPNKDLKKLLGNRYLNYRSSDDPYIKESIRAEKVVFKHTGYEPDVQMYELPTVGITVKEMTELKSEVVAGIIEIEKIKSGEEVVLAVPQELLDICLQYYPVGSMINFDDIKLSEEEEKLNFNTLDDPKWIVYDNHIQTGNGERYVSYGAFGTKYQINARVGAIVALTDNQDVVEYLTTGHSWVHQLHNYACENYDEDEPAYGMSILCLSDSFTNWGLPDKNFTSVKVKLKDSCDIYQFDRFWYEELSGSVDVQTKSTFDYVDRISIGTNRVMTIFFVLMIVLIMLGVMSIISGLYTKTRSNTARFQTLRRIGLSIKQSHIMLYTQNMFYPLISTLFAIVPIYILQIFFNSVYNKVEAGDLDITELPWYTKIPYWANLFSYDFIPSLICCLIIGNLLILIGTLPQILYMRKMKMIETREE